MRDELELHGVVLSSAPSRDFDKRLSVLTNEQGKITVVEIKRKAAIKDDNVAQDLIKLSQFMTKGFLSCGASPYNMGVLILTGGSEDDIKNQLKLISNKEILNPQIYCVFCDGDNSLKYVTLSEL